MTNKLLFIVGHICCKYYAIFVCPLSIWKRRNIDITMLRLLKILHITHNENESEVDKNIEMTKDENKSCALLSDLFHLPQNL